MCRVHGEPALPFLCVLCAWSVFFMGKDSLLCSIHNIDSFNSNIAFDSSNKISKYLPILGTGGIRPPAAPIVQIGARMFAPAS